MKESQFFLFLIIWALSAIGYGGGIVYGLHFLRKNTLVDTRVPQFVGDLILGRLGTNYKMFCFAHSQKYGTLLTKVMLTIHFASVLLVFVLPVFWE
ncbi:MAG: hypothetical protein CXR31_14335 [Geobacter sp.]|nr:MAG: hypothetical protein CXR31_14335 [Geobacter sp.]